MKKDFAKRQNRNVDTDAMNRKEIGIAVGAVLCFVLAVSLLVNPISVRNTKFIEKCVNAQIEKTDKLAANHH